MHGSDENAFLSETEFVARNEDLARAEEAWERRLDAGESALLPIDPLQEVERYRVVVPAPCCGAHLRIAVNTVTRRMVVRCGKCGKRYAAGRLPWRTRPTKGGQAS